MVFIHRLIVLVLLDRSQEALQRLLDCLTLAFPD